MHYSSHATHPPGNLCNLNWYPPPPCACKALSKHGVDFQKAYDSVSFSFLKPALLYIGLSPAYVGVLMSLMSGPILFFAWDGALILK